MMIDDPYAWSDTNLFKGKSCFIFILHHCKEWPVVPIKYVQQQDNKKIIIIMKKD